MKNGLLSILVPVYQVEKYLRDCVDSLLCQSVPLEIWLVDDGSTDGSVAICDAYARMDARVRVIHKQNGGLASARLAGIEAARGEYLAFVDSDDWVDDNLFECLLAGMRQDTSVDCAAGGYVTETEKGTQQVFDFVPQGSILSNHEAGYRMFASQGFNWSLCGKVYRSAMFQYKELLQNWPHGYGEDTFINYHLLKKMRNVAYVPVQGYHYRMRSTSMMHQSYDSRWMAYFEIYDEIFTDAEMYDPQLAEEILNVMVNTGLSIRRGFLRERCCSDDIETTRAYFQKWLPKMGDLWTPQLRQLWDAFALVSAAEYEARKKQFGDEIRSFSQEAKNLYLYGTGRYGVYFARWLEDLGIPWHGAIESSPHGGTFFDKDIFALQEIDATDAAIIVAMNQKNTEIVLSDLRKAKFSKIMEGWKMMELL